MTVINIVFSYLYIILVNFENEAYIILILSYQLTKFL